MEKCKRRRSTIHRRDLASQLILGNVRLGLVGEMVGGEEEKRGLERVEDLMNMEGDFDIERANEKLKERRVHVRRERLENVMRCGDVSSGESVGECLEEKGEGMIT